MSNTGNTSILKYALLSIWIANCLLGSIIAIKEIWIPSMDATNTRYPNIQADAFDGTTLPITVIPNWLDTKYRDKTLRFSQIPKKDLMEIPKFDAKALLAASDYSGPSTILRFTYTVMYMGNYNFDYKEYVGGHLGVDVRSVIGTPVYSIANGIVERAEIDATGNKFVTIRHDGVPIDGKKQRIFSNYLHLSEILATPGTKVKKGEIIGKIGTSGISTAPHLHFQIDREDAPFHPYFPFTTAERRAAGLSFFEAVSAGLGKERGLKYTIHPYNFVYQHLDGSINTSTSPVVQNSKLEDVTSYTEPKEEETITYNNKLENIVSYTESAPQTEVAGKIYTPNNTTCQKTYTDIAQKSQLGENIYTLQDRYCLFRAKTDAFLTEKLLTRAEALRILMRYFNFPVTDKRSQFLDITLTDTELQSFALVASEMGIASGQYFYPNQSITKGELLNMANKLQKLGNNQKGSQYFEDIQKGHMYWGAAQKYAALTRTATRYFSPFKPLTKGDIVEFLGAIEATRN